MHEAERWLDEHPTVHVFLADKPESDWRREDSGYGWIFKAWFRSWTESRRAVEAIRDAGFDPKFWGRKVRVLVTDGYEGQKVANIVLERWPNAKIQIRND